MCNVQEFNCLNHTKFLFKFSKINVRNVRKLLTINYTYYATWESIMREY